MNKEVRPFEEYKETIKDMSKEELINAIEEEIKKTNTYLNINEENYEMGYRKAIYDTTYLFKTLKGENDKLHSIIKEVREYIEENTKEGTIKDKRYFYSPEQANDILEILDKGE